MLNRAPSLSPIARLASAVALPLLSPGNRVRGTVAEGAPALVLEPTRRWDRRFGVLLLLTDLVMVAVALHLAQFTRFGGDAASVPLGDLRLGYEVVGAVVTVIWLVALTAFDSRKRRVFGAGLEEYRRVINASFFTFGLLAILSFLGPVDLSRFYFVVALPVGTGLLLVSRFAWRLHLGRVRIRGGATTGTVVVGDPVEVATAVREMRGHPEAGYTPVAVALTSAGSGSLVPELPRISVDDLRAAAKHPGLGAVMIAGSVPRAEVRELAWDLETGGCELLLVSQLTDVAGPRIHQSPVEGLPVTHVDLPRYSGGAHVLKRSMDVTISSLVLVLLAPLYLLVALAIKIDDRGPVLFRQCRVGQNGTTFTMHKFRTMSVDAEARLASLRERSEGNGVLFKMHNDPRVTRVGQFLRKYSIDEFPQFWDVLTGRMSVVGPRPPLPSEVATYERHVHRRLLIKPGVTGLWQVSGRSNLSWDESVRLDLRYVENWSVTGDLVLILKTVRAVLKAGGAY